MLLVQNLFKLHILVFIQLEGFRLFIMKSLLISIEKIQLRNSYPKKLIYPFTKKNHNYPCIFLFDYFHLEFY